MINRLKVHVNGLFSHDEWRNLDGALGQPSVHIGMYQRIYDNMYEVPASDVIELASAFLERATVIVAWADEGVECGAFVTHRGTELGRINMCYPTYDWDEFDADQEYADFVMHKINERVDWAFDAARHMWWMSNS